MACLGALALLPADAVRAEMAVAALDGTQPATEPIEPDLDCLALNIYWEARSESRLGQLAVAAVTLNRVAAPAFPDTVCEVVFQGEERGRHLCQFSWRCDGRADEPRNPIAWEAARRLARLALSDGVADPTGGALWYHADDVLPRWAAKMALHARIGHHLFYGRTDGQANGDGNTAAATMQLDPVMALATSSKEVVRFAGELRIDFEADPAAGLWLCGDELLCGNLEPQVQAVREEAAIPALTGRRTLGPEPSLATELAPSAASRTRSSIPIS